MRTLVMVLAATVAIGTSGCAASRTSTLPTLTFPTLASATATVVSTEGGENADSLLTVHLLRSHQELGAEIRLKGAGSADPTGALALTLARPSFTTNDLHDGQVRVRLVPDRDHDLTFDLQLTMRFSDGMARNFVWRGIRLDYTSPDRVLLLAPARI